MEMLTVSSVAQLKGCTARNVQDMIKRGALPCETGRTATNRPQYLVPLAALDPALQTKWRRQSGVAVSETVAVTPQPAAQPLDSFDAAERAEIACWVRVLNRWQNYRNRPDARSKAEVDAAFVALMTLEEPELSVSVPILYRKYAAMRAENWAGLLDRRGKWKRGTRAAPAEIFEVFEAYYLNESRHPIERCIEYTRLYFAEHDPAMVEQMPSYSTFRRRVEDIPYPVRILGRQGEKAYYDLCSPYVRRQYENIASNEWWVADTHTFDIISRGGDGKTHRIYINAYLDARSGIFTGWYVTANPSSDASLFALRRGILEFGIPKNIYVDNGREYLTYDIGGRGHRAKKTLADGSKPFAPPGVYERLGIKMTNAIVRNARAKIIERRFRDVKDHISRLFLTYCGGTVVEKPDRLKHVLADDRHTAIEASKVVRDEELVEMADTLIRGYMNRQPYNGSVDEDKGRTRLEVWEAHRDNIRMADPEELTLMLMRTTRPQMVGRDGVWVEVAGKKLHYRSDDLATLMRQKVYVRYDPDHLGSVRVYNMEDRFLTEVPLDNTLQLPYGADKEKISEAMATIRKARRVQKAALDAKKLLLGDEDAALNLVLRYAEENIRTALPPTAPNAIELVRAQETPLLEAVGTDGRAPINIQTMTRNAARRNDKED